MSKEENKIIKINNIIHKKEAFLIEDNHPAIGRILIVDGKKFKVLDEEMMGHMKSGTFIKQVSEDDERLMKEFDEELEELSEKLTKKVDIKRLIKENIKQKSLQEIKTGLFILKAQEEGEKVEEEHHRGCYNYKMYYKNQGFELMSGDDIVIGR